MARMIPPVIDPDCQSPGEKEIFRRLRDDPGTEEWIVLHSLDVVNHARQVSGEIDFVIIIPSMGVLCLEVKAHQRVERREGLWYFGSVSRGDPRSPFRQASMAMHSLRDRIAGRNRQFSGVVFWTAVVFPYTPFSDKSEEWHPWQVIDGPAFRSRDLGTLLQGVLGRAHEFLRDRPTTSWFRPESGEPTPAQCRALVAALRGDFEVYESPALRARRQDEEVKHYTAEQFEALEVMDANPRVLFTGPAGTGKTLLAVEAVRRGRATGRRVLLACFNRRLGRWLGEQVVPLGPEVVAGTLHRHMLTVARVGAGAGSRSRHFWEEELPSMAMEQLLENPDENLFDEIVIDEAQDLFREGYLDFLDLSLKGGLAAGRWRMFADFERQAIFASENPPHRGLLEVRGAWLAEYSLRTNCRNTPRIADLAYLLGGMEPGYTRIRRPDDGIDPELHYYSDAADQGRLLIEALKNLYEDGYRGQDIVVLSKRSEGACAADVAQSPWRDRLRPLEKATSGHIAYSSIHAFKGMEAPAVVVTDVEHVTDPVSASLFYVASTRPLHRLVILMSETAKKEVVKALRRPRNAQYTTGG